MTYFIFYNTRLTKDILYVVVNAKSAIEACQNAEELLKGEGQGVIEITGVERLC